MQKWMRYCKVKIEVLYSVLLILFDSLFHVFSLNIHIIWPINRTKWWIIKVKHPSSDIYRKNISLMKIKNIILVLRTRIILLSSFVIYFFCICHSGRFPIVSSIIHKKNLRLVSSQKSIHPRFIVFLWLPLWCWPLPPFSLFHVSGHLNSWSLHPWLICPRVCLLMKINHCKSDSQT